MNAEDDRMRMRDRIAGVVLGTAVGDALGAGYEFGSALLGAEGPQMIGGGLGGFAPGEWTDDTTMAWCVLDVAARGQGLLSDDALTVIAGHFRTWYGSGPSDIGNQTRWVMRAAGPAPTAQQSRAAAAEHFATHTHSAGNGSLGHARVAGARTPSGMYWFSRRVFLSVVFGPSRIWPQDFSSICRYKPSG